MTTIDVMTKGVRATGLAGCLALALAGQAAARAGDPDRSFSDDGLLVDRQPPPDGFRPRAAALQGDGKVIVAGAYGSGLIVTRYLPDGRRDASFGTNGFQLLRLAGAIPRAASMAIDPRNGRIVIGGSVIRGRDEGREERRFLVTRLLTNGSRDPAFSDDGMTEINLPGPRGQDFATSSATDLAVDGRGRITAAGLTDIRQIGVVRLAGDGGRDRSFSGDGKRVVGTRLGRVSGYQSVALALGRRNRIVLAGEPVPVEEGDFDPDSPDILQPRFEHRHDFGLVQLKPDGRLDRRFGRRGKVRTRFTRRGQRAVERATDVAVDGRGRIVLVGDVVFRRSPWQRIGVARYSARGRLDRSFSGNGILTTRVRPEAHASHVIVQRDRKVVVAAEREGEGRKPTLVRYTSRGRPDRSFGRGGIRRTGVNVKYVVGLLRRPGSRLWLVAESDRFSGVLLARYLPR